MADNVIPGYYVPIKMPFFKELKCKHGAIAPHIPAIS